MECLTKKIKTMCGKIETYCEKCCTDSLELMDVEWDDYGKRWSHYICTECEEEYWCDYYYGFD